ncbi:MAG: hypothetical protein J2P58_09230 [Acidimicrobiaceae bacterium]|nr:hypothetical protein [Acidimicrobiaceae bacterium]
MTNAEASAIECKMYLAGNSEDDALERCAFGDYGDAEEYRRDEDLKHVYSVLVLMDPTTIKRED